MFEGMVFSLYIEHGVSILRIGRILSIFEYQKNKVIKKYREYDTIETALDWEW